MYKKTLSNCRILVTPTTFGKKDPMLKATLKAVAGEVIYNPFARPLKAADLYPLIKDVDGYIAGVDEVDASVIQAAKRLKMIARYGVGIDRVDIAAATERGIVVTNSPGANSVAVAELTIGLMLALARNICAANEAIRRGEWPALDGVGLKGKTIGIIGFGAVGKEVALRLKGFSCRLLAFDPYIQLDIAEKFHVKMVSLEDVLSQADFVTLHVPVLPSTAGMVNHRFLGAMKPGAFLINTARGELIDEEVLIAALKKGHLRGTALDCFSEEPPDKDNPLLSFPQVIVTPHTGAHTDEAISRMGWISMENCLAVLRGERPPNVVNPEVYEKHHNEECHV